MSEKSAQQAQREENEAAGKKTAKTTAEKGPGTGMAPRPEKMTPVPEAGKQPLDATGKPIDRTATDNAMERAPKDIVEAVPKAPIGDPAVAHAEGIPFAVPNPERPDTNNITEVKDAKDVKALKKQLSEMEDDK